ncbi:MAG: hypothetical protein NG784_11455 [Candidatus Jettenia sp.]|nr:hypothetical protein [Candidatus Jettenia sp.]
MFRKFSNYSKYGVKLGQKRTQGSPLVRLRVCAARGVRDLFRENAFRPVTDPNCVTVRWGSRESELLVHRGSLFSVDDMFDFIPGIL